MDLFASRSAIPWAGCAAVLVAACGARTSLEATGPDVGGVVDAGPQPAGCLPAPEPTVLVSLEAPGTLGAAHYSLTGDASRIYTYVWGPPDPNEYSPTRVLSIDPCTGASVVISSFDATEPIATDGAGVYFQIIAGNEGSRTGIVRSDALGQATSVVAAVTDFLTGLTIFGGRGYAVTQSSALVTLALDGSAPTTLVPQQVPDKITIMRDGCAVDDSFVYFYGAVGLEKIPKSGGPTTIIDAGDGALSCGGAVAAPDPIVAVDDAFVYLSCYHGVRRVAKDGSSSLTYPGTEMSAGHSIAVDATHVYYADEQTDRHTAIRRVPKSGGPVELVASTDDAGGIVVTDTSIYWLDYTRAVMKLDKPKP